MGGMLALKKRWLAMLLAAVLCAGAAAGCKPKDPETSGSSSGSDAGEVFTPSGPGLDVSGGDDSYADYTVEGKVKVGLNRNRSTDFEALFDTFSHFYPNVTLSLDRFDNAGQGPEYMTAKAQSGDLPDIMFDDPSTLPYFITQGWVYPLNDFVKDDPDYDYVPKSIQDTYTYGGHLFAIAENVHFQAVFLNLDIMEELNLEHPELDWTMEEYGELLKKATNTTYSGAETLFSLDANFCVSSSKDCTWLGYNYEDRTFHMSDVWAPCVSFVRELREVPGLEAWSMRWNGEDGATDYIKKFGNGNVDDLYMAFKLGLTLTEPERSTWDAWLVDLPFDWELWTFPQGNGNKGRFPMHVDCNFMTTAVTAENVDAAFQVLRYTSYSVEGNLARQSMWDEENKGKYELNLDYTIPATLHPKVAEKFKSNPHVTEPIAYMYDCIPISERADVAKIVPGWDAVNNEYILEKRNAVTDGLSTAEAAAAEVQDRASEALQQYWEQFDADLEKFISGFTPVHTR